MSSPVVFSHRHIRQLGATARSCILGGGQGTVLAVVSQALYLLADSGELFWITTESAPLHRRCVQISAPLPALSVGSRFRMQDQQLELDASVVLDLQDALTWCAPSLDPIHLIDLTGLFSRTQYLFSLLDYSQTRGFGVFIPQILSLAHAGFANSMNGWSDPILRFAQPLIFNFARACLDGDATLLAGCARPLIGLGSGLTPSGDDFLGGFSFTLAALQAACPDRVHISALLPVESFRSMTNPISFTLLRDLASGHAVEPLHNLLLGLLVGDSVQGILPAVAQLTRLGHSTGWDLLTGLLAGMLVTTPAVHLVRKSHYLDA